MTNERTLAYGRVVKTLDELGPTKLTSREQQLIRDAADILIFAADMEEARKIMKDVTALVELLVSSDRWLDDSANTLLENLLACGPEPAAAIAA